MTTVHYNRITEALVPKGLLARGGFAPEAGDGLGEDARCVVMVGNAGPMMWPVFAQERQDEPDAMNAWARRTLAPVAEQLGAAPVYPFDGPPWLPFQRWAQRAEPVFPSPIGMLIHPEHGLWHAYRGALIFAEDVEGLPEYDEISSPCESCADKPCLTTCLVGAFTTDGYDVPACADHMRKPDGADCLNLGCRARRACPVGQRATYLPDQAAYHMAAFLASH